MAETESSDGRNYGREERQGWGDIQSAGDSGADVACWEESDSQSSINDMRTASDFSDPGSQQDKITLRLPESGTCHGQKSAVDGDRTKMRKDADSRTFPSYLIHFTSPNGHKEIERDWKIYNSFKKNPKHYFASNACSFLLNERKSPAVHRIQLMEWTSPIWSGKSFTKNSQKMRETVSMSTVIRNGRTCSILSHSVESQQQKLI